ncbi:MAG: Mut7-C RNAse domain-containing protein [Nitriliruptorales bacterium]
MLRLRFEGRLARLAGGAERVIELGEPRSVKDAVESVGVPHTEIGRIRVGGDDVGFDALLSDEAEVAVWPSGSMSDPAPLDPAPRPARFVCDVHLGRLAERLRLLGFDTRYRNDLEDDELVEIAADDARWLLTRDRRLLMRAAVTHGCLVRTTDPDEQAVEVAQRFDLAREASPFSRCLRCNGLLEEVAKAAIEHRLQPGTRRDHDEFVRCRDCERLYWPGSHRGPLEAFVSEILDGD